LEFEAPSAAPTESGKSAMMKNTVRGILGLVLTAAATWLANYIVDQIFGPDEVEA
jgi:hypothetical protein